MRFQLLLRLRTSASPEAGLTPAKVTKAKSLRHQIKKETNLTDLAAKSIAEARKVHDSLIEFKVKEQHLVAERLVKLEALQKLMQLNIEHMHEADLHRCLVALADYFNSFPLELACSLTARLCTLKFEYIAEKASIEKTSELEAMLEKLFQGFRLWIPSGQSTATLLDHETPSYVPMVLALVTKEADDDDGLDAMDMDTEQMALKEEKLAEQWKVGLVVLLWGLWTAATILAIVRNYSVSETQVSCKLGFPLQCNFKYV